MDNYHNSSCETIPEFGVVGDSFACGTYVDSGELISHYSDSWGAMIADRNGIDCFQFSVGGCTTRDWLDVANEKGIKLLKETKPLDLYIIALGINDCYSLGKEYLGTANDINFQNCDKNEDSFYGNYAKIISEIRSYSASSEIILLTMYGNDWEDAVYFNEAIIEISELFEIPCIRLHEHSFFQSELCKNNMIDFHPTLLGYSEMSKVIEELLKKEVE